MAISLRSLTELPSARVFAAAEKRMVRSTGVGGFIFTQNGNLRCLKLVGDFSSCHILLFVRFFRKEKGKYTVTLINRSFLISLCTQHEVVLLVMLLNCTHHRFLIIQFLAIKL